MRTVAGLCTVLISSVAYGQQVLSPLATHVIISTQDCQRLVRHVPAPDVAYKPGVDVHGKTVAPADLAGSNTIYQLPDHIEFNYTINPVNYGLTKSLAAQSSALSSQQAAINSAQASNQSAVVAANQQKQQLLLKSTTLTTQLTSAQSALATLQAKVTAGTLSSTDSSYLAAKASVSSLQSQITANTQAIASQSAIINPAQASLDALNATKSSLSTTSTSLATQLSTAQATLSTLQAKVTAGTLSAADPSYINAKAAVSSVKSKITTNDQAIAANAVQVANAQGLVNAGVTTATQLSQQATQLQAQEAAIAAQQSAMAASGPGGGNTQMQVATIRYDFASGQMTINGKPLDSADQQGVATECRNKGIK